MIDPNEYGELAPLIQKGMNNRYAQDVGGFVIVRFSNGTYDWFPIGAIPQRADGTFERRAPIVLRVHWNHHTWRVVDDYRDDIR